MLLAIDVGNTNITFGVFDDKVLRISFRLTTQIQRTSDEFGLAILDMLESKGIKHESVDSVIISSVVPGIMYSLNNGIYKYFGITPMQVGHGTKSGIRLATANPREIGADRIVDCAAAYEIYGGPVLVIDFGTATTYDLVSEDGAFEAGVTCPGLRLCANALSGGTAKLPEVEIALPPSILAKDTITSIQAGLVYACIGQTEYIVREMIRESGYKNVKVVATGGLGRTIADSTDSIDIYDGNLTLEGLRIIFEKSRRNG